MSVEVLDSFFSSITPSKLRSYSDYWESVKPTTFDEVFKRWIFAFTSIHTTWESNVRAYNALKNYEVWIDDQNKLKELLIESRCGLHNMRTKYIWDFKEDYFKNTVDFSKRDNESWGEFRDRLTTRLLGIGITKVSFTLEMCYPNLNETVCLDTHMMQIYGMKSVSSAGSAKKEYEKNEADWLKRSQDIEASTCVTRALYWDMKQGQPDSRYWSYVLES